MAWWSVHWTLDQEVWVQDLAGSMCFVLEQNTFTPTVPLFTLNRKWTGRVGGRGVTLWWTSIPSRGGSSNAPGPTLYMETWITSGWVDWQACKQTLQVGVISNHSMLSLIKHIYLILNHILASFISLLYPWFQELSLQENHFFTEILLAS